MIKRFYLYLITAVLAVSLSAGGNLLAQSDKNSASGSLVKLRMIVLKKKSDAQSVLTALEGGSSFIKLAKEISAGPNADKGGHIGTVDINRLKPDLRDALKGLEPGQHTMVVETAMGHTIFLVTTDKYYEKGLKLFDRGRYADAVKEFLLDLKLNPDSAFSHFYLGLAYQNLNQHSLAASSLEKTTSLKPDLVETYYNLGRVYASMGRIIAAEKMYLKTIEMAPDYHLAYNNLAWLYAKNRLNLKDGIKNARIAIMLSPSNPLYYHTLAVLLKETGNNDKAVMAMKEATKFAPEDQYYRDQLALLQLSPPKIKEATPSVSAPQVLTSGAGEKAETEKKASSAPISTASLAPGDIRREEPAEEVKMEEEKYNRPVSTNSLAPSNIRREELKDEEIETEKETSSRPVSTDSLAPSKIRHEKLEDEEVEIEDYYFLSIKVLNGNGVKGAATEFTGLLESMDYDVEEIGNAEHFDWKRTTVLYREGMVEEALSLAHKIPGEQDVIHLRGHEPFDIVIILGQE